MVWNLTLEICSFLYANGRRRRQRRCFGLSTRPRHTHFRVCSWWRSCTPVEPLLATTVSISPLPRSRSSSCPSSRDTPAESPSPAWRTFRSLVWSLGCSAEVVKQGVLSWDVEPGLLSRQQAHQYHWDHPQITHTDEKGPCRFGVELLERLALKTRWWRITWIWNRLQGSLDGGDEPTFIMRSHLTFCCCWAQEPYLPTAFLKVQHIQLTASVHPSITHVRALKNV